MRNLSASDVSLSSSDEKHIIFWWEAYQLLIRGSLASYEKLIIFCQKNVTQFHRKQICYHPCSTCPGPNTIISRARDSSKDFAKKVRFSKRIGDANGCGRHCVWCSSVFICWLKHDEKKVVSVLGPEVLRRTSFTTTQSSSSWGEDGFVGRNLWWLINSDSF